MSLLTKLLQWGRRYEAQHRSGSRFLSRASLSEVGQVALRWLTESNRLDAELYNFASELFEAQLRASIP